MLVLTAKQVKGILLLSALLFGLALGGLLAQIVGRMLQQPATSPTPSPVHTPPPAPEAADIDRIVRNNIFDPASRGQQTTLGAAARTVAVAVGNLKLLGTVDGGDNPLAVVEAGGKAAIYHLGDALPGGGTLKLVERNRVLLLQADGSETELVFAASSASTSAASASRAPAATGNGIRDLGGNRWQVAQEEVERARANLGQLLKQARMEPNVVDGRTEGFAVRMIRPNTLLARLGLRVGDVVHEVNGVELDSPEKAIAILQQLREAKRLSIALTRGSEPLVFTYEVN